MTIFKEKNLSKASVKKRISPLFKVYLHVDQELTKPRN